MVIIWVTENTQKVYGAQISVLHMVAFFFWHDEELNNSRDPWSTGNFTSMPPGRLPNMAVLGFGGRPNGRPTSCYRDYILQLTWKNLRIPKGQAIPTIMNWFDFRQVTWSISGYHCTSRFPSWNLSKGNCYASFHFVPVDFVWAFVFCPPSYKHTSMLLGYDKLPVMMIIWAWCSVGGLRSSWCIPASCPVWLCVHCNPDQDEVFTKDEWINNC